MDCRHCQKVLAKLLSANKIIAQLKKAKSDKEGVEKDRDQLMGQITRIVRWLSANHIPIPENSELEEMYPS